MAELIDPRPKLVLVMGCNGSGKSAWKRANYDRLPERYFDQDSIAGGIGDWNDERTRARTGEHVREWVDECFAGKLDFGFESTFSGRPGPALLDRALGDGYRVEGYYLGTRSPEINASRIDYRVLSNTGHYIDPRRLPERYRWSLSNLRQRLGDFDVVEVVDNSEEAVDRIPAPVVQFVAERGEVKMRLPEEGMAAWCVELLRRREVVHRQAKIREERSAGRRGTDRGGR